MAGPASLADQAPRLAASRSGGGGLRAALVIGPIALIVVLAGISELPRQQLAATAWVTHTLEVLEQTAVLDADIATATGAMQTFLLDHDAESRTEFAGAVAQVTRRLATIRELTTDNPVQQDKLDRLAPMLDAEFSRMRQYMDRPSDGTVLVPLHRQRPLMTGIETTLGAIKAEERGLLARRTEEARIAAWRTLGGLLAGGIISATCATLAIMLLMARRAAMTAHLDEMQLLNAGLEGKVQARTAELLASRTRLSAYVDHLADGLLAIKPRPDGQFVYEDVNAAARTMLGLDRDIIGLTVRQLWPDRQGRENEEKLKCCVAQRTPLRYSTTYATKIGPREFRIVIMPVASTVPTPELTPPQGPSADLPPIDLLLVSVRDVTHEVAVEAQLRQAQRMEAVGQLTAGIAHDFNNNLQTILGSLELLHERPRDDPDEMQCIALAQKAAHRGALLTHRLLAFSRKQELRPVPIKPEQILADLAGLLAQTLGGFVQLETSFGTDVWWVQADDAQLENCLLNLALNARDAMPEGGIVRLGIENIAPAAAAAAGLRAAEHVRFTVADNGIGMSRETQQRAFEPFFTTKEVGKGTGLGLSMVHGFARQSGGDVRIESTPGQGTVISLYLPRAADVAEPAPAPAAAPARLADNGRGRVLVVDDDPAVGQTLALFLRKGGYKPVAVESADAALQLLRAGDICDLLVTDQSMPVMTGCQLIEEVGRLRPALPTMLVTGFDIVKGLDQIQGNVTVLRKPFERRDFLHQVQTLLDDARQGASALDH